MLKKWAENIREKTKEMTIEQKVEYVMTYYWYHMLIAAILVILLILTIYHIGWGKREKDFTLIMINQEVDFERDQAMADAFADYSGMNTEKILFDSDYLISYDDVNLDGVNESSYEKLFFNWSAGEIDAMIMPESFFQYCKRQDGTFMNLDVCLETVKGTVSEAMLSKDAGKTVGIYLEDTKIADDLRLDPEDRLVLVFPENAEHTEACRQFLDYLEIGKEDVS